MTALEYADLVKNQPAHAAHDDRPANWCGLWRRDGFKCTPHL